MEQLKSIIPELKLRSLTYDIHPEWNHPEPDDYLVSISEKTMKPTYVYLVASARIVRQRTANPSFQRIALQVAAVKELLPKVHYDPHSNRVWVDGKRSWPLFSYPKKKKN